MLIERKRERENELLIPLLLIKLIYNNFKLRKNFFMILKSAFLIFFYIFFF